LDTSAASGGDGFASGVVGEGEGEEQRASECVWELGREVRVRPRATGRRGKRRGGGQLRVTHAVLAVEQLLACAGEHKQLAGTGGGLGQQVGLLGGLPG
jgi:hypothetical protein